MIHTRMTALNKFMDFDRPHIRVVT